MSVVCRHQLAMILDKIINKDVKNAGNQAAQDARSCVWVAALEPILDANYPDWRTDFDEYP